MGRSGELLPGNPWLRRLRAGDGAAPLLCFHHAGGHAGSFRPVANALPADFPVLAVQCPGRQNRLREAAVESIPLLADSIVAALAGHEPEVLFGHSMGAFVAFEVARRLPVRHLVVSSMAAPSRKIQFDTSPLEGTDRTAQLRFMSDDMRFLGSMADDLANDENALSALLPTWLGDHRALAAYLPDPGASVSCDITALVTDDDPRVAVADTDVWREHTTGKFELRVLRGGGHFHLEKNIDEVSGCLVRALERAESEART
ncbi:MAG: thioesterase II family protein [Segniliparus sp.]|uniref:thioesterase II family protein n=1 Tax=Segniliparus sp. TaxID=2804064 RepID=UPI003F3AF535